MFQIFDKQKREKRNKDEGGGESDPLLINNSGEDVEMVHQSRKDEKVLRRPRGHTASIERMELKQLDEEKG